MLRHGKINYHRILLFSFCKKMIIRVVIVIICVNVAWVSSYPYTHLSRMRGRRIPNPRQIYSNQNMLLQGQNREHVNIGGRMAPINQGNHRFPQRSDRYNALAQHTRNAERHQHPQAVKTRQMPADPSAASREEGPSKVKSPHVLMTSSRLGVSDRVLPRQSNSSSSEGERNSASSDATQSQTRPEHHRLSDVRPLTESENTETSSGIKAVQVAPSNDGNTTSKRTPAEQSERPSGETKRSQNKMNPPLSRDTGLPFQLPQNNYNAQLMYLPNTGNVRSQFQNGESELPQQNYQLPSHPNYNSDVPRQDSPLPYYPNPSHPYQSAYSNVPLGSERQTFSNSNPNYQRPPLPVSSYSSNDETNSRQRPLASNSESAFPHRRDYSSVRNRDSAQEAPYQRIEPNNQLYYQQQTRYQNRGQFHPSDNANRYNPDERQRQAFNPEVQRYVVNGDSGYPNSYSGATGIKQQRLPRQNSAVGSEGRRGRVIPYVGGQRPSLIRRQDNIRSPPYSNSERARSNEDEHQQPFVNGVSINRHLAGPNSLSAENDPEQPVALSDGGAPPHLPVSEVERENSNLNRNDQHNPEQASPVLSEVQNNPPVEEGSLPQGPHVLNPNNAPLLPNDRQNSAPMRGQVPYYSDVSLVPQEYGGQEPDQSRSQTGYLNNGLYNGQENYQDVVYSPRNGVGYIEGAGNLEQNGVGAQHPSYLQPQLVPELSVEDSANPLRHQPDSQSLNSESQRTDSSLPQAQNAEEAETTNSDPDALSPREPESCEDVNCPPLQNCLNSTQVGCCPVCTQLACPCEGYQRYDCISNGFKDGLVPEGDSYTVDMGSTVCRCPTGGGAILCSFQNEFANEPGSNNGGRLRLMCPPTPVNCIETYTREDGCVECLAVGCVDDGGAKVAQGTSISKPPCTSCYCPQEGGELVCLQEHSCTSENGNSDNSNQIAMALEVNQREMKVPPSGEDEHAPYNPQDGEIGYDTRLLQPDWNTFNEHQTPPKVQLNPTEGDAYEMTVHSQSENHPSSVDAGNVIRPHLQSNVPENPTYLQPSDDGAFVNFNPQQFLPIHQQAENGGVGHALPQPGMGPEIYAYRDLGLPLNTTGQRLGNHVQDETRNLTNSDYQQLPNELNSSLPYIPPVNGYHQYQEEATNFGNNREDRGYRGNYIIPPQWYRPQSQYPISQPQGNYLPGANPGIYNYREEGGRYNPEDGRMSNNMRFPPNLPVQGLPDQRMPIQGLPIHGLPDHRLPVGLLPQGVSTNENILLPLNNGTLNGNQATSFENILSVCCSQGKQWARSNGNCQGITLSVQNYRQTCVAAQEKCCQESLKQQRCDAGVTTAKSMSSCEVPNVASNCVEESFKTCCDCCALGLKAHSLSLNCDMTILGQPCNDAYSQCCRSGRMTSVSSQTSSTASPSIPTSPTTTEQTSGVSCAARNCEHLCTEDEEEAQCGCRRGYELEDDERSCTDINECVLGTHNCVEGQFCLNLPGGFNCQRLISCGTGYELTDRNTCDDIDECALNIHDCSDRLNCVNIRGSFRCVPKLCSEGYFTDATGGCIDIDECRAGDYTCPDNSVCKNADGSYNCVCGEGYTFNSDNRSCQDVDECAENLSNCADGSTCVNNEGSYFCNEAEPLRCEAGFEPNTLGTECIDIDECARATHTCASGSTCINDIGSFRCQDPIICARGTRPSTNHRTCIDIDECELSPGLCGNGGRCVNSHGSYYCECNMGFEKIDPQDRTGLCRDVDECGLSPGNECAYQCENNPGSFSCICPGGYISSQHGSSCSDVDECLQRRDNCSASQTCFNTRGSFRCVDLQCPEHYVKLTSRRCIRQSCRRARDKRACIRLPRRISFNNISVLDNAPKDKAIFRLDLPGSMRPKDKFYFFLTEGNEERLFRVVKKKQRRRYAGIVYTTQRLRGPRDFVLDLTLKLYRKRRWATFLSRLYIYVSEYGFK